jgi:hypothetical protein
VRTVSMPAWVKAAVGAWTRAAGVTVGPVVRAIDRYGNVWGRGMTAKCYGKSSKPLAKQAGIEKFALYDLRRTCARLCHLAGGELDQHPVLAAPRLGPDDGALPRLQAEDSARRERPTWDRTGHGVTKRGGSKIRPSRLSAV